MLARGFQQVEKTRTWGNQNICMIRATDPVHHLMCIVYLYRYIHIMYL